jgi:hypothetical protein
MLVATTFFILLTGLATQCATGATLSETVTDESGIPIKDAHVDHTGKMVVVSLLVEPSPNEARTDTEGRFQITTVAPAIVVRKPGYKSTRVPISGDATVKILLQLITEEPQCKQQRRPR